MFVKPKDMKKEDKMQKNIFISVNIFDLYL